MLQALRYPYFHVGQALGTPVKYSEQHRAKMPEAAAETKPLSLCKTDVESIERQTCSQSLHQPLQQILLPPDNMEPSTKQATCSSTLTEGQQEPLSLVKNRQAVGIAQLRNIPMGPSWGLTDGFSLLYFKADKSSAHGSREQHDRSEDRTPSVGPDVFQVCGQLGRRRGRRRRSLHL